MILAAVLLVGLGSKMIGGLLGRWIVGLDGWTMALLTPAVPGRLSISVAAAEIGDHGGFSHPNCITRL